MTIAQYIHDSWNFNITFHLSTFYLFLFFIDKFYKNQILNLVQKNCYLMTGFLWIYDTDCPGRQYHSYGTISRYQSTHWERQLWRQISTFDWRWNFPESAPLLSWLWNQKSISKYHILDVEIVVCGEFTTDISKLLIISIQTMLWSRNWKITR